MKHLVLKLYNIFFKRKLKSYNNQICKILVLLKLGSKPCCFKFEGLKVTRGGGVRCISAVTWGNLVQIVVTEILDCLNRPLVTVLGPLGHPLKTHNKKTS